MNRLLIASCIGFRLIDIGAASGAAPLAPDMQCTTAPKILCGIIGDTNVGSEFDKLVGDYFKANKLGTQYLAYLASKRPPLDTAIANELLRVAQGTIGRYKSGGSFWHSPLEEMFKKDANEPSSGIHRVLGAIEFVFLLPESQTYDRTGLCRSVLASSLSPAGYVNSQKIKTLLKRIGNLPEEKEYEKFLLLRLLGLIGWTDETVPNTLLTSLVEFLENYLDKKMPIFQNRDSIVYDYEGQLADKFLDSINDQIDNLFIGIEDKTDLLSLRIQIRDILTIESEFDIIENVIDNDLVGTFDEYVKNYFRENHFGTSYLVKFPRQISKGLSGISPQLKSDIIIRIKETLPDRIRQDGNSYRDNIGTPKVALHLALGAIEYVARFKEFPKSTPLLEPHAKATEFLETLKTYRFREIYKSVFLQLLGRCAWIPGRVEVCLDSMADFLSTALDAYALQNGGIVMRHVFDLHKAIEELFIPKGPETAQGVFLGLIETAKGNLHKALAF
jgi:hypothetical protein